MAEKTEKSIKNADSTDVIAGQLRAILTAIGGGLASKGYIQNSDIELYVGIGVTVIGAIWSIYAKRREAKE